jgi:hypothetical protein
MSDSPDGVTGGNRPATPAEDEPASRADPSVRRSVRLPEGGVDGRPS